MLEKFTKLNNRGNKKVPKNQIVRRSDVFNTGRTGKTKEVFETDPLSLQHGSTIASFNHYSHKSINPNLYNNELNPYTPKKRRGTNKNNSNTLKNKRLQSCTSKFNFNNFQNSGSSIAQGFTLKHNLEDFSPNKTRNSTSGLPLMNKLGKSSDIIKFINQKNQKLLDTQKSMQKLKTMSEKNEKNEDDISIPVIPLEKLRKAKIELKILGGMFQKKEEEKKYEQPKLSILTSAIKTAKQAKDDEEKKKIRSYSSKSSIGSSRSSRQSPDRDQRYDKLHKPVEPKILPTLFKKKEETTNAENKSEGKESCIDKKKSPQERIRKKISLVNKGKNETVLPRKSSVDAKQKFLEEKMNYINLKENLPKSKDYRPSMNPANSQEAMRLFTMQKQAAQTDTVRNSINTGNLSQPPRLNNNNNKNNTFQYNRRESEMKEDEEGENILSNPDMKDTKDVGTNKKQNRKNMFCCF
eukprot:CAMPEP_0170536888 /NCGR_PEP_ID=MMETSP0209-20121228/102399_1 /TAXON_ID=665100 ORGANISM="Litonotus pictus, Strain P1" /NCGR_SAMPLE_ID=MMETSP0209 /ASSEMBLY_ACC=CAM_ASM_000301 /LENGTH=465 /DNA_ID=CAMNT_0010838303 /DNA_START=580 /DNA_END=1978 /DNA_ORIENTATION=-